MPCRGLQLTWQPAPCRHAAIPTANQSGTLSTSGQYGQQPNQGQQGQWSGGGGGTNNAVGQNGLYRGNGNGNGGNPISRMTFNGRGGSYPTQGTSNPLFPIKKFNNRNYCHTHGGNIHNSHTSATCAQRNLVSIIYMLPPDPTLWVVTTRGYLKPYSHVPLDNVPQLCNQSPSNPPTTPPPLQCHLATMDCRSLLLPAAGAFAHMQLPTNAPTTFPFPNQEHP
jgi:hypothetical protein